MRLQSTEVYAVGICSHIYKYLKVESHNMIETSTLGGCAFILPTSTHGCP